jgi:hypothetical protein
MSEYRYLYQQVDGRYTYLSDSGPKVEESGFCAKLIEEGYREDIPLTLGGTRIIVMRRDAVNTDPATGSRKPYDSGHPPQSEGRR